MKFVIASDNNYFNYTYVALNSLLDKNKNYKNLEIVFIHQNISIENSANIQKLSEKYKKHIELIDFAVPLLFEKLPSVGESKTTFAKFTFSSLFEDDIVVFLDPDILVMGDLSGFEKIDMSGYLVAGVIENLPYYHREFAKMSGDDSYINGGVLIMNLKLWRELDIDSIFSEYIRNNSQNFNYDQGIINEICKGKIKILEPQFNALAELFEIRNAKNIVKRYKFNYYYTQEQIDFAIKNPVIVHFTHFLYGKPLSKGCLHPYTEIFIDYLNTSGMKYELKKRKIDLKIEIRRFFLKKMPFKFYILLENILDIRRKYLMKKQIKN